MFCILMNNRACSADLVHSVVFCVFCFEYYYAAVLSHLQGISRDIFLKNIDLDIFCVVFVAAFDSYLNLFCSKVECNT